MEITTKSKTASKPQSLPPAERAPYYNLLRVHLQVIQWKKLMTTNADPLEWGWKVHQNFFAPISTDLEPAPKELLNLVCCNCKTTSWNTCGTNICFCQKNGLTCVAACGGCRGESCKNFGAETEDENEDRNLFEQLGTFTFDLCDTNFYIMDMAFMHLIQ